MLRLAVYLLVSLATAQTVHVKSGTIQGGKCQFSDVNNFLGVPYAVPPVGDLRFAPPQAFTATYPSGTLQATAEPKVCIQFIEQFSSPGGESEDWYGCRRLRVVGVLTSNSLYLNIYAPPTANEKSNLPVKFWIHGGAFTSGGVTDGLYDGCNVATDSIVVLAAYRLGALGFLYDPAAGIAGNMAIQDLQTALEWVQSNIASFGGNPVRTLPLEEIPLR
jgi:carboxylesterase type B